MVDGVEYEFCFWVGFVGYDEIVDLFIEQLVEGWVNDSYDDVGDDGSGGGDNWYEVVVVKEGQVCWQFGMVVFFVYFGCDEIDDDVVEDVVIDDFGFL